MENSSPNICDFHHEPDMSLPPRNFPKLFLSIFSLKPSRRKQICLPLSGEVPSNWARACMRSKAADILPHTWWVSRNTQGWRTPITPSLLAQPGTVPLSPRQNCSLNGSISFQPQKLRTNDPEIQNLYPSANDTFICHWSVKGCCSHTHGSFFLEGGCTDPLDLWGSYKNYWPSTDKSRDGKSDTTSGG